MRKFDARWWRTPLLDQWRMLVVISGGRCPWHFVGFGYLTQEEMDELCRKTN